MHCVKRAFGGSKQLLSGSDNSSVKQESKAIMLRNSIKWFLSLVCVLGLIVLNVVTLINGSVHAVAFNALKTVLASSIPEATVLRLLSNSPSQKFSELQQSNKIIETQHAELKKVVEKRAGVFKIISERISRRTVNNAVKNTLDAPAEAVPILGIAVMLALTASDIYDDCQTLKDLNELNISFEQDKHDETAVCGLKVPALEGGP